MSITITGIDDFPTQLDVLALADGRTALCTTHFPNAPGEIAYSAAYLIDRLGQATKIIESERLGKDIACCLKMQGTVLELWVSESPPGGSGAQSVIRHYDKDIGIGASGGGNAPHTHTMIIR